MNSSQDTGTRSQWRITGVDSAGHEKRLTVQAMTEMEAIAAAAEVGIFVANIRKLRGSANGGFGRAVALFAFIGMIIVLSLVALHLWTVVDVDSTVEGVAKSDEAIDPVVEIRQTASALHIGLETIPEWSNLPMSSVALACEQGATDGATQEGSSAVADDLGGR